jgi:hypothetical protein
MLGPVALGPVMLGPVALGPVKLGPVKLGPVGLFRYRSGWKESRKYEDRFSGATSYCFRRRRLRNTSSDKDKLFIQHTRLLAERSVAKARGRKKTTKAENFMFGMLVGFRIAW